MKVLLLALALPLGSVDWPPDPDAPAVVASCGGKYSGLLFRLPSSFNDSDTSDRFTDYGWWMGGTFKGWQGLPEGYWVYSHPFYYVWKHCRTDSRVGGPWQEDN